MKSPVPVPRGVYESPFLIRGNRRHVIAVSASGYLVCDAVVPAAAVPVAIACLWNRLDKEDPEIRLIA